MLKNILADMAEKIRNAPPKASKSLLDPDTDDDCVPLLPSSANAMPPGDPDDDCVPLPPSSANAIPPGDNVSLAQAVDPLNFSGSDTSEDSDESEDSEDGDKVLMSNITFGPHHLFTHNPLEGGPPPTKVAKPFRPGFNCKGCEHFQCTSVWREWTDIGGEWGTSDEDLKKKAAEEVLAQEWAKAHELCWSRRFMCDHNDGTSTLCRLEPGRGKAKTPLLVCPTCNSSRHIFEPLLAGGGGYTKVIPTLRQLYLYAVGGYTRGEIAKKVGVNENTVGRTFVRFDRILATESWFHSFSLHKRALELEAKEVGIYFQGDEVTYSGQKYGRGKPTCIGSTQWFQTIVLLYNTHRTNKKTGEDIYKVADFSIIPVADRKAHTLLKNIAECVPQGRKIVTDCWRAYYGLGSNYEYQTVNHKKHFKDPVTHAHTNHVESLHRHLKAELTGALGKDASLRIIRVMASAAVYRGRKLINHSHPFLAALHALRYVCRNARELWVPKTLEDGKVNKFPNLVGLDDSEDEVETMQVIIKEKEAKAKNKAKSQKEAAVASTKPRAKKDNTATTATAATATAPVAVVTVPKEGGTPKRPRGRPPSVNIPTSEADWEKVPAEKLAEMIELAEKIKSGLGYAKILHLTSDNDSSTRRRTEKTVGPPREDETARALFAGTEDGGTQPQPTPVTQTQDEMLTPDETQAPTDAVSPGPKTLAELYARGGKVTTSAIDALEDKYGQSIYGPTA